MTTEDTIRDLIAGDLDWHGPREELTADLPLLEGQVLDSLDMLRLVSLLEERLGVTVRDEDLVLANFGSIEKIAAYVDARRSAA